MVINSICFSIFLKENCIEYNMENTIKLLKLFKEKNVITSFVTELGQDMKQIERPLIKSSIDNILLILGSLRIDMRNDDLDKIIGSYSPYSKEELLNYFEKFKFYFEKLKSNFENLNINRVAINLYISCDRNDITLSSKINCLDLYNADENKVISNLSQKNVIKLFNFKKSKVNAIFNLIASDKLNIKFDINTLYNINNKFENEEIYSFFNDSIELINNLVLKLEE